MSIPNSDPGSALDAPGFCGAIEIWCARNGMSAGAFGAAVYRDRDFVASLRDGRRPCLRTVDRALAVMGEPPAGPAFLGEGRCLSRSHGGQALAARTGSDRQPLLRRAVARGRVAEAGNGGSGARVDEVASEPCRVA